MQYVVLKRYNVVDALLASLDRAMASGTTLSPCFPPYRSDVESGGRATVAPFLKNTDARLNARIEIWRID